MSSLLITNGLLVTLDDSLDEGRRFIDLAAKLGAPAGAFPRAISVPFK